MKKFKKLLSVLLAVIMALSCFTVIGSAYQDYENPDAYFYDSNDNPRSYLYTDEQRFSFLADTVNDLLKSLNININEKVLGFITIKLDLRSLDSLFDSFDGVSGYLDNLGFVLGDLGDLDFSLLCNADKSIYNTNGAQDVFNTLIDFLGANADKLGDIIQAGDIDLGVIGNFVNLDGVSEILGDLPGLIGGIIYGLGTRKLTNGIGDDPEYPNSLLWDDMANDAKPNFDTMVQNLIFKLLTQPNNTESTKDPARNLIITNPEAYGATSAMIHQDEEGYYYIYGTKNNAGNWVFTEETTTTDDSDKQYISQWKDSSALLKGVVADEFKEIINLTEGDLYTMLEKAIPWAYNAFGGHNLDGQLRATLMQFCGAFNNGDTVDDATKEELKAIMDEYKGIEYDADGDKAALRDAFAAKDGAAGNVNFMYIDLEGKKIGDKTSDSLYYVVEWGGSYQYYHVELGENGANVNALFDLIDWEYQAPMWETIAEKAGVVAGQSFLLHINDIVGTILKTAMPSLTWTAGTADNTLRDNLVALMKVVINNAKAEIWGEHYELPADFDSYNLEQALVLIAGELLDMLMPQLVLPADVSSVEEVAAYALREFMAEIMPHLGAGWDAKIDAAAALSGTAREDAFLDVLLNMGVSTGAYYLQNLIGLGTKTNGSNTTSVEAVPMGADYEWKAILDYIVDWVIATFVPRLTSQIDLSGDDPLDKLSAVLSTLAPTLAKTLGANTDSYALDLNHVYEDLRLALNGDFSELAKGLMRKTSGTSANMTAMGAIATLLTELFGGLGLNTYTSRWSELKGVMDNAAASTTPLTTLIGTYGDNTNLAKLLRPFIACLAGTRTIWFQDAICIILHLIGGLNSKLTNTGVKVDGIETAYTGATEFDINYSFEMVVTGVRTYFNNGRYKTTAGAIAGQTTGFDGIYQMKFYGAKVVDENGNKKGEVDYGGYVAEANVEVPGTVHFSGVTEKIETYTLETYYAIIAPDGTEGEQLTHRQSFVVTSLVNDSLTKTTVDVGPFTSGGENGDTAWTISAGSGCSKYSTEFTGKWQFHFTNIYISEVESLSKVATPVLQMTDLSSEKTSDNRAYTPKHSYSKAWVRSYGSNTYNDDGSITVASDGGAENIIINDGATTILDTWFKWAGNENALSQKAVTVPESGSASSGSVSWNVTGDPIPMWVTESNKTRSDFTDDYYTYKIQVPLSVHADMTKDSDGSAFDDSTMDRWDAATITTYITLYNSYDLQSKLDDALVIDKTKYDTSATEWTTFQSALDYAKTQMYGQWVASQFQANHTINVASLPTGIPQDTDGNNYEGYTEATVSTFKYAGDRLEAAMAVLDDCKLEEDTEDEATLVAPKDPSSDLNGIYNYIMEVEENTQLKSHNYVLYRWFKFSDIKTALRNVINAATPPTGEAYNTLVGVPLDNEGIEGVIAEIEDANVKAIVETLVEAPTQEAIDAAAKALADYVYPEYDVDALKVQMQDMKTNEKRLVPKYDAQQKYFLNDAITNYGNETAANYTAESYANYKDALDYANEVNGSSTANQYEIFSARYDFLVAYNALVLDAEKVNMEALHNAKATAQAILAAIGTEDEYTLADDATVETLEDAYKALVLALGVEVAYDDTMYYIGGNFNAEYALAQEGLITAAEQQPWVDSITANLDTAIANFKAAAAAIPTIAVKDGFDSVIIDTYADAFFGFESGITGVIYGIETLGYATGFETFYALADVLTTTEGDEYLQITASDDVDGYESTGSLIEVIDGEGNVLETYYFVYFGDMNGDGYIDNGDATAAETYALDGSIDSVYAMLAGDANADTYTDNGDATAIATAVLNDADYPVQEDIAALYWETILPEYEMM